MCKWSAGPSRSPAGGSLCPGVPALGAPPFAVRWAPWSYHLRFFPLPEVQKQSYHEGYQCQVFNLKPEIAGRRLWIRNWS